MITILTWLWRQEGYHTQYTAEHVNIWADMVRRHARVPHELACVTDMPEGIDPAVRIIPLPRIFERIQNRYWSKAAGRVHCYRRLDLWRRDAAKTYGERICSMDLDVVIRDDITPILTRPEDVVLFAGTAVKRPYNGSLLLLTAGARPKVYESFTPAKAEHASSIYAGSDQAWISYALGWAEATYTAADGVHWWERQREAPTAKDKPHLRAWPNRQKRLERKIKPRMLFFPGRVKPWDHDVHGLDWVADHYRRTTPEIAHGH
jgi:hypothetical protein